ncbi:hypothetical protein [Streptomyces griseus]|uniref:hypothetical protein n=1 Tax=Streptomyces griseus TaxID=1911 RepID=UPI0033E32635
MKAFQARRPGDAAPKPGRPRNTEDQVPRDQVPALVAELLDADPTISAATVTERLDLHRNTGQDALTRLRADRIADHIEAHPTLTPTEAAAQLGYPAGKVRRATAPRRRCPARPPRRPVPGQCRRPLSCGMSGTGGAPRPPAATPSPRALFLPRRARVSAT